MFMSPFRAGFVDELAQLGVFKFAAAPNMPGAGTPPKQPGAPGAPPPQVPVPAKPPAPPSPKPKAPALASPMAPKTAALLRREHSEPFIDDSARGVTHEDQMEYGHGKGMGKKKPKSSPTSDHPNNALSKAGASIAALMKTKVTGAR